MGVFDGTTICLVGIKGEERKNIGNGIKENGGKISTSVRPSVKFLITSAPVNMKLSAVTTAIKLNKPIVKPEFITQCIQQNKLLNCNDFQHDLEEKKRKTKDDSNECLPPKKKKTEIDCELVIAPQIETDNNSTENMTHTQQEFADNLEKFIVKQNISLKDYNQDFLPGTFPYQPVLEVKDLKQKDLYSLGIIFAEYIRFLMEGELEFLSFDFEPNEWDFLFAASKYKKSIINFFTEKINGLKGLEKD